MQDNEIATRSSTNCVGLGLLPGKPLRVVEEIVIHHSLTEDGDTLSWGAIRAYHMGKGWDDIGYHGGAELVRGHYEVLEGRPVDRTGAHCFGQNYRTLGFCFVGNYDDHGIAVAALRAAVERWIGPQLLRFRLTADALVPHSKYAQKTCPGRQFPMILLRALAIDYLNDATKAGGRS